MRWKFRCGMTLVSTSDMILLTSPDWMDLSALIASSTSVETCLIRASGPWACAWAPEAANRNAAEKKSASRRKNILFLSVAARDGQCGFGVPATARVRLFWQAPVNTTPMGPSRLAAAYLGGGAEAGASAGAGADAGAAGADAAVAGAGADSLPGPS